MQYALPRWRASLTAGTKITYYACPPGSGVTLNPPKP